MLNLVVCIKQVPMVSELPWDSKTGTLRREVAEGMMNPACMHALEAALCLKRDHGARVFVVTMGPPMAEEVLHEALALGADQGILLTDRRMAGADTLITSRTLAHAIKKEIPEFDLILCGSCTSDSETAQVGPQMAEELDIPGAAFVEGLAWKNGVLRMKRQVDDFLETLEMDLPGLVTVTTGANAPRYVALAGLTAAFDRPEIVVHDADSLGLDADDLGMRASPTRILDVYSPASGKANIVLKGAPKRIVEDLLERFDDRIIGAMGKDLKTHDHGEGI